MGLYLADHCILSGVVQSVEIVIPKNATFLAPLLASYPHIAVTEISRKNPWGIRGLIQRAFSKTLVLVAPTPGYTPLLVKVLSALLGFFPGNYSIGFKDKSIFSGGYKKTLEYDFEKPIHETLVSMTSVLGYQTSHNLPELKTDVPALQEGSYVVIHPCGSSSARSFLVEELAFLVRYLQDHMSQCGVFISVSKQDETYAKEALEKAGTPTGVRIVAGADMTYLMALLKGAKGFVGVDTGITHLACFLHVPTLVVAHGGTMNWLPWHVPTARILFKLTDEEGATVDRTNLQERVHGRLRPFGHVPVSAVCEEMSQMYTA